ncbi:MAG: helix-turn-helix domain-containing protein [Gammaproteobacteria bacterium]
MKRKRAVHETKATAEEILSVAAKLFLERGYAATSIREIRRVSRRSGALVYQYFSSKEDIFREFLATLCPPQTWLRLSDLPVEQLAAVFDAARLCVENPKIVERIAELGIALDRRSRLEQ